MVPALAPEMAPASPSRSVQVLAGPTVDHALEDLESVAYVRSLVMEEFRIADNLIVLL